MWLCCCRTITHYSIWRNSLKIVITKTWNSWISLKISRVVSEDIIEEKELLEKYFEKILVKFLKIWKEVLLKFLETKVLDEFFKGSLRKICRKRNVLKDSIREYLKELKNPLQGLLELCPQNIPQKCQRIKLWKKKLPKDHKMSERVPEFVKQSLGEWRNFWKHPWRNFSKKLLRISSDISGETPKKNSWNNFRRKSLEMAFDSNLGEYMETYLKESLEEFQKEFLNAFLEKKNLKAFLSKFL